MTARRAITSLRRRGWTITRIAAHLGVSRQSVYGWWRGQGATEEMQRRLEALQREVRQQRYTRIQLDPVLWQATAKFRPAGLTQREAIRKAIGVLR